MAQQKPLGLVPAEFQRTVWHVFAESTLAPQDLLVPSYWAHVAEKLKPQHRIEVASESGDWWAEYFVLERGPKWARVALMREMDLRQVVSASPAKLTLDDFEIKLRGMRKQSIVRKADKEVIKDGFESRQDAEDYLLSHLKSMAA